MGDVHGYKCVDEMYRFSYSSKFVIASIMIAMNVNDMYNAFNKL